MKLIGMFLLLLIMSGCWTIVPMINFGNVNLQPPELRILNQDQYKTENEMIQDVTVEIQKPKANGKTVAELLKGK